MKTFTIATLAVVAVSSVAAAAMEPRATPKPLEKRQDDDIAGQVTGLLNPLTPYLSDSGIASLVESVAANPDFASAAGAAGTSDFAPFITLVESLQADADVSSAIYGALGTQSADEFYASASGVVAELQEASATATDTATDDAEPTEEATTTDTDTTASATTSPTTSSATGPATSAPASGALGMVNAGSVLPAVLAVFGIAAGAILL